MKDPVMKDAFGIDRRKFLRRGAMGAGAMWALSLDTFMARKAFAAPLAVGPYGDAVPTIDDATGLPLLRLPPGFRYRSYGWNGDTMSDGIRTPGSHDGMAVVDFYNNNPNWLVLVRNHEVGAAGAAYLSGRPDITYLNDSGGGTTNLVFDTRRGRFVKSWASLAGTRTNCAGGVTPWGTWVTCEETASSPNHGFNFEVGAEFGSPTPLVDMGRFAHEAMMVDPATGIVYETEDQGGNSGFYKFIPHVAGDLSQGGELYMLAVVDQPGKDLRGGFPVPTTWDVEWVRINDPRGIPTSVFNQGFAAGGARFDRLEGAWWGNQTGYFLSTEGGTISEGQVFEYNPIAETLSLIYESPNADALSNPDNVTVSPRGGLLLCEDQATGSQFAGGQRLIGLDTNGQAYTFGVNNITLTTRYNDRINSGNYRGNEWAGACFSPDGQWLFVNIQSPGVTFAITGPWSNGNL